MSGSDFWRSIRGVQLAERTLPQLVIELRRLNDNLEKLMAAERRPDRSPKECEP